MVLSYDLISVTSEDAEGINAFKSEQPSVHDIPGNGVCWISQPGRSYPQSLIIRLHEIDYVYRIDVMAHPQFIPSSMTVSFGLPNDKHRHTTGHSYDADYTHQGDIYFVENDHVDTKQLLHTTGQAYYIRFSVHGFYKTSQNPYSQAGIISIVLNGSAYDSLTTVESPRVASPAMEDIPRPTVEPYEISLML